MSVVVPVMTVSAEVWSPENAATIATAAARALTAWRRPQRMGKGNAVVRPKAKEIIVFPPCEGVLGNGVRDVPARFEGSGFFGNVFGGATRRRKRLIEAARSGFKRSAPLSDQVIVCVSVLLSLTAWEADPTNRALIACEPLASVFVVNVAL